MHLLSLAGDGASSAAGGAQVLRSPQGGIRGGWQDSDHLSCTSYTETIRDVTPHYQGAFAILN